MLFKDLKDPGFCESIIWDHEYVNALTSFSMLFVSIMGLFLNRTHNYLIMTIWSCFFVNFIGSFAFHYTLYQGWGMVDTISMLIAAYFGAYTIITILLEFFKNRTITYYFSMIIFILSNTMLVFSLSDRCLDNFIGFNSSIAVPFITIIISVIITIIVISHRDIDKRIRNYLIIGVVNVFLSSLIWLLTEPFCYTKNRDIAYTFSHAFWHVFVSYGFYLIAVCFIYIHGNNRRGRSDLSWVFDNNGFFYVFPRVYYKINESRTILL